MSKIVIEGKVSNPVLRAKHLGITEPTEKMFQNGKGLAAKKLVHTNCLVPLRIINLGIEVDRITKAHTWLI